MNLETILQYIQIENPVISETILLNTDDEHWAWAYWNPSMFCVAEMTAEYFNTDVYEDADFAGLWEAACEIVRRDNNRTYAESEADDNE